MPGAAQYRCGQWISEWDCALEEREGYLGDASGQPILRRAYWVTGCARLVVRQHREHRTRAVQQLESVDDPARRAGLSTQDLQALAQANALEALAGHRRQPSWEVAAMRPMPKLL